jgi:hypothetical protein
VIIYRHPASSDCSVSSIAASQLLRMYLAASLRKMRNPTAMFCSRVAVFSRPRSRTSDGHEQISSFAQPHRTFADSSIRP